MDQITETTDQVNEWTLLAWNLVGDYAPSVLLAIITLVFGLWIVGVLSRSFRRVLKKRDVDPSLTPFLSSLFSSSLKVLLGLSILSMVGIEVTSFIAILGAASFAVGLALQGSLQNFAGGVMVLLFKPFKVGDYVEMAGYSGSVKEIQIFVTILTTPDNKTIIIPNGQVSSSSMVNYSKEPTRRVDFTVGIGYGDSMKEAKSTLLNIAKGDERVHPDPEPFVGVVELADSSVNIAFRVWVDSSNYWLLFCDFNEKIKNDIAGCYFLFSVGIFDYRTKKIPMRFGGIRIKRGFLSRPDSRDKRIADHSVSISCLKPDVRINGGEQV